MSCLFQVRGMRNREVIDVKKGFVVDGGDKF